MTPEHQRAPSNSDAELIVDALVRTGRPPRLVFQPVVDIRRMVVVAYEALSRFPGPVDLAPDAAFAAADRIGCGIELESAAIAAALSARTRLPTNCFLSVNVSPEALVSPQVGRLLRDAPLSRVVFELTEHSEVEDYQGVLRVIADIRAAGGFVAVDDAGAGYASLHHILVIRPDFVKLDRTLIVGIHADEAKGALVEMFGHFTSRTDAWLVAEGIENLDELRRLIQLGVPLGQGNLLGRPAAEMGPMAQVCPDSGQYPPPSADMIGHFVEAALTAPVASTDAALDTRLGNDPGHHGVILLDPTDRPALYAVRTGCSGIDRRDVLRMLETTDLRQAVSRAMTRPHLSRFDPLACCDRSGRLRGMVLIERLVEALAWRYTPPQ
ncbi:EAL domain-containing protein [Gordonia sp. NPDC003950]